MKVGWIACIGMSVALGSGCFSKTHIYSKPAGARAVLDGRLLGPTPIELDEQVWLWTKHTVTLTADGYVPSTIRIKNVGINYGYVVACLCTVGLLAPLAFLSEYPQQYVVELIPLGPTPAPQAALSMAPVVSFR